MTTSQAPARRTIACTGNAHKVEELAALLQELELEPMPAGTELPPEIGETFLDNARIKGHAGHGRWPDRWVLADDSGLSVDALHGAPGVRSARFAGEHASDTDNTQQLLERLAGLGDEERGAHFVCVLVLVSPDGHELVAEGRVDGRIIGEARGAHGFGYDPVFVPAGELATFGELGTDVKARLSHRARAAAALRAQLQR